MSAELLALLHTGQATSKFAATSRYYSVEIAVYTKPDGSQVAYLKRRFAPDPSRMPTVGFRTVLQGDRLDTIANEVIGDSEQFWRIADANAALNPIDLESVGQVLRIAQSEVD